jgi:hypothetical protein
MDENLRYLIDNDKILGEYDAAKVSGLPPEWFRTRWIDVIDFRGDLQIRSQNSLFGRHIRILTASHSIVRGTPSPGMVKKRVWIEKDTFIGSYALLYNCHIRTGAVVSCGSVVSNMIIPAHTLVEGNPARIIGHFENGLWKRIDCPEFIGETGSGMRYWEKDD